MNFYNLKAIFDNQKATLLWEYNLELKEEDFENIESQIFDPSNSDELTELITTLYLFYIALEKYKDGNFWDNTIARNDSQERRKFHQSFNKFLNRYNLFVPPLQTHGYKFVTPLLIHAVLPKHYANQFLGISKKIYEKERDLDYLLFMPKNELETYFEHSIESIKKLISNDTTILIIKDLVYRTVKTIDYIYDKKTENLFNLPIWFFEKIKIFLKDTSKVIKYTNLSFMPNGYVTTNFDFNDDVDLFFFDEKEMLITTKQENNMIYFTKEPKFLIINKNSTELIEEIEDYFSSPYYRWNVINKNFYCYELEEELINEELGKFQCKIFELNYDEITLESIKKQFPIYLKSTNNIETYFDGIIIKNYSKFSKIYLNNNEMHENYLKLNVGSYELKAISSLGQIVKNQKIQIIPFCEIEELNNKICIDKNQFEFNDIITINGFNFEYDNLNIFLQDKLLQNKSDIMLFRQKNNYQIQIQHKPKYIKHLKISYEDINNKILDKNRVNNNNQKIEISEEIKNNSSFPIKIFIEYRNFDKYKKVLIGTIYHIELKDTSSTITIEPDINIFNVVIQSKYDIFSKPLKTDDRIVEFTKFPTPKSGDFNIIIYDKDTNTQILKKIITLNHIKSNDPLVNYFANNQNFRPPNISIKNLKTVIRHLKNIHYHYLDDEIIEKLNFLLIKLYKENSNDIDSFILEQDNLLTKLKYMILFNKQISISYQKTSLKDNIILAIKIRFPEAISSLKNEFLEIFFNVLQKNSEKNRVKIFEILEYHSIQEIINKSIIKERDEA
ncbi:MAG: hypothetical protein R3331_06575 [Sulfurospirillaceae bacterium]|nr:hypothetical protein [Sulfurospirillaceae bacterium]